MAHGMDCQKELLVKLKIAKAAKATAQNAAVERVGLLRKIELNNDMLQVKIHQLKLDMATIESSKVKAEEKGAQLKWKLERTMSGFAKEKKELEAVYQQKMDDMFFYVY